MGVEKLATMKLNVAFPYLTTPSKVTRKVTYTCTKRPRGIAEMTRILATEAIYLIREDIFERSFTTGKS